MGFYKKACIIIFFPLNYFLLFYFFNKNFNVISFLIFICLMLFLAAILFLFINIINKLEFKKNWINNYPFASRLLGSLSIGLSITVSGIFLIWFYFSQFIIFFIVFIVFIGWIMPILIFRDYYLYEHTKNYIKNVYLENINIVSLSILIFITITFFLIWNLNKLLEINYMGSIILTVYNFLGVFFFFIIFPFYNNSYLRKKLCDLETNTTQKIIPSEENIKEIEEKEVTVKDEDFVGDTDEKKTTNIIIRPKIKQKEANKYYISSYFLGEINEYFKEAKSYESLCLMGGLVKEDNSFEVRCISKPVIKIQKTTYAKADQLSLHKELTKFDDSGHSTLILCHCHPGNGPSATDPKNIDEKIVYKYLITGLGKIK